MIDTNEVRGQWGLWYDELCRSPQEIDLKTALDEIDRLRAERNWYKLALVMIANDDYIASAKTVAQNALNYSPENDND